MRSIRIFLVSATLAALTLFNFIAALQGYRLSMAEADLLFDTQLTDIASLIAAAHGSGGALRAGHPESLAFQVWDGEQLLLASGNAPETPIADPLPGFGYLNYDGYRWRTLSYFDASTGHWIDVAERTDLRFALAEKVILGAVLPIVLVLPLIGIMIWLIVTRGLRPLNQLAAELAKRQPNDLQPLRETRPRRELQQVMSSINALLQRIEGLLQRERSFASDAAHELRTPISALKVQVHNLAQSHDVPRNDINALRSGIDRMGDIVEKILLLYRTSPEQFGGEFEPVDLYALCESAIARMHRDFEELAQHVELHGVRARIRGNRFALETLLGNLLGNACKFTPRGGAIRVAVESEVRGIQLTIEDSGPGIEPSEYDAVFRRFHRIGGDRHRSGTQGSGLGLAIVQHVAELHGATVSLAPSRFPSGIAFHVHFPATETAT